MKKDINDELQNKNIIRVLEHNFYDVSEIEMLFFSKSENFSLNDISASN